MRLADERPLGARRLGRPVPQPGRLLSRFGSPRSGRLPWRQEHHARIAHCASSTRQRRPRVDLTVTDAVMDDARAWRRRPLDDVYPVVFLDAFVLKVKEGGSVQRKACYLALGVRTRRRARRARHVVPADRGAKFWMQVLGELKQRGVQDILICCVDGLTGFPEAIEAIFPRTRPSKPASFTSSDGACATSRVASTTPPESEERYRNATNGAVGRPAQVGRSATALGQVGSRDRVAGAWLLLRHSTPPRRADENTDAIVPVVRTQLSASRTALRGTCG